MRLRVLISALLLAVAAGAQTPLTPTPLLEAAKAGDAATLRMLIGQKADVNAAAPDGSTALHWASHRNDLDSVKLLLAAGANVNAATDLGVTPLWTAAENGSAPVVRALLDAKADPNIALFSGETPLMVAARSGRAEAVELLASAGAKLDAHGTRGQTALMWAAAEKHPEVVKVLLAHHADITLKSDVWTDVMAVPPHGYLPYNKAIPHGGETALMFAARVGDLESAKLLVAAGANPSDEDAWGVSATTLAAHSGLTDVVLFLLDQGADPNAMKAGFSALHVAVMRRDEKMVAALLAHGANADAKLETWTPTRRSSDDWHFDPAWIGATPYWLAAHIDEAGIMRMLVDHGADPLFVLNAKWYAEQGFGGVDRTEKSTALLAALNVGGGRPWLQLPQDEREAKTLEAVKLALDLGVDINAETEAGHSALDTAQQLRYASVIEYLTAHGGKAGSAPPPQRRGFGRGGR